MAVEVNNREQEKWCKKKAKMKSVSQQRVDCTSTKFNYPLIRVDIRLKMGYLSTRKRINNCKNKRAADDVVVWRPCFLFLFLFYFRIFTSLKSPQNYYRLRYKLNDPTIVHWNTQCGTKVAAFIFHIHCRFYHHRSYFTSLHFLSSNLRPVLSLFLSLPSLLPCTFVRVCLLSSLVYNW